MVNLDFLNAEHARALDMQGLSLAAPKRIWVKPADAGSNEAGYWVSSEGMGGTEYIRADLAASPADGGSR